MFTRPLKATPLVVLTMAAVAWSVGWARTEVYAQHNHMTHRGQQRTTPPARRPNTSQPATTRQAAVESPGPHGGRMTTISYLAFEVVYQPQEIRVYVYGPSQQSQSARDVQGEVGLRRRNSDRTFTGTLQYVAPPPGTSEQDYLAVRANLSGVNDGDMMSTVKLANLPFRNRSELDFCQ